MSSGGSGGGGGGFVGAHAAISPASATTTSTLRLEITRRPLPLRPYRMPTLSMTVPVRLAGDDKRYEKKSLHVCPFLPRESGVVPRLMPLGAGEPKRFPRFPIGQSVCSHPRPLPASGSAGRPW